MTQGQSQVKVLDNTENFTIAKSIKNVVGVREFSHICRTSPRTLRFYDKLGLLKPAKIDQFTNYRYYYPDQARDFFKIKLLQNFHVPLKNIQEMAIKYTQESFLANRLKEVRAEIEEKKKEENFLKEIKNFLFDDINKHLKHEKVGPFVLLCKKLEHTRYDRINSIVAEMYKEVSNLGIKTINQEIIFYLKPSEYSPKDTALEICLICQDQSVDNLPQNLYFKNYSQTQVLAYSYKGPHEYLTFVHGKIMEKYQDKKFQTLPFDWQIIGVKEGRSEFDYLTKVCYPVEKTD